jgi:predicted Fe-S protein YdhL (DUF1289 family)
MNLFVLPRLWYRHSPFGFFEPEAGEDGDNGVGGDGALTFSPKRPLFSDRGMNYVKNVSIALCSRGVEPLGVMRSFWDERDGSPDSFDALTPAQRLFVAHEHAKTQMTASWCNMLASIAGFQPCLMYLELDLTNAFCPLGCCRMLEEVLDRWWMDPPKKMVVLGLRGREERIEARRMLELIHLSGESEWVVDEDGEATREGNGEEQSWLCVLLRVDEWAV